MTMKWYKVDPGHLEVRGVAVAVAGDRALALTLTDEGWGALDNRCPHQGGPLGEGEVDPATGCLLCPWHGYEYDPVTGAPPAGFSDAATSYRIEVREDGLWVELPELEERVSLMDQMVEVMTDWGVDTVFGMVGHSNLGLADALRRAEEAGKLRYIGIRHEGAAAFAASGYAKLTGRPAACFSIAGPGATNLLTGLWDAKVDRAPVLALTGQVNTQVLGPGTFQEVPLASAFDAVAAWGQTVLTGANATELMALALKHAIVERDVAHLIFPDEVQELEGLADPPARPRLGRVADHRIAPPDDDLDRAVHLLDNSQRPLIVAGNGARPFRVGVQRLAERLGAPVITTFKAKGLVPDDHPLGAGVVGRSGTPVPAALMARADAMLVLGASFSNHSGLATWVPTIQVDFDRMTLGKFHPVEVPLWGDIGRTLDLLEQRLRPGDVQLVDRSAMTAEVARRKERWRAEAERRAARVDAAGRMHPAALFLALSEVVPAGAAMAVDVGNNTYAFGHYFETKAGQDVVMSGYLGSIGFSFPAALGLWAATRGTGRRVVSVSGDGGFGQYLAEFTTAVKYGMDITHVLLDNAELGKISREQIGAIRPVWQTDLVNPDFADFARSCGGTGFSVRDRAALSDVLAEAMAPRKGPTLVHVQVSARDT
jgi:thiamine pyrophosphate-dependent acetolactate synthase large subunit-like protein/nitrite reductase/ring-hydroxylating ferredoxin subunit